MAVNYRIFGNLGGGGPVDYATVLATVTGLSWTPPPVAHPSDWTWAVRAFDTVTGLEEKNVVATVRKVTDSSGADVTNRPPPPTGLSATAVAGGKARLRWSYRASAGLPAPQRPTGFRVYAGTPTPSFGAPVLTVPYLGGQTRYTTAPADVPGLADGVTYQFAVRAYNAAGEEPNADAVTAVGNVTAPLPPDSATASLVA